MSNIALSNSENMREKIIAANWKMNTTVAEGIQLTQDILEQTGSIDAGKRMIIAPPFTHLQAIADMVKTIPRVSVAAQNCFHETKGAFTGEISPPMLKAVGCGYVIIGHS